MKTNLYAKLKIQIFVKISQIHQIIVMILTRINVFRLIYKTIKIFNASSNLIVEKF